ncbi:MAG: hypothetical protein M3198_13285 [Actinomycetota bacterium]|nr:hypothetical protein [Actinomycetota bacterium]
MANVKLTREGINWIVWLDEAAVGRFPIAGDALDYAQLLECDPRVRAEATAGRSFLVF